MYTMKSARASRMVDVSQRVFNITYEADFNNVSLQKETLLADLREIEYHCSELRKACEVIQHKWNDEFCSCGSDCCTCQYCGKQVCGTLTQWIDGKGNVCLKEVSLVSTTVA
jgi:hypothetical protein